jgi:putative ABC transport system permease protein
VLAGWGTTHLANAIMDPAFGVSIFKTTPRLAVGAVVFTVLLGMSAGVYPALRAARLDPVKALRGIVEVDLSRRGLWWRIIHALRSEGRMILTVSGVAVGIFALTVIGSLSEYLNGAMTAIETGSADSIAVYAGSPSTPYNATTRRVVARTEGVRNVVIGGWGGTIEEEAEGDAGSETFYGIDSPTGELDINGSPFTDIRLWKGRFLTFGSTNETVVGFDLAERRGLTVGSTLTIRDRDFVVVGVYERLPYGNLVQPNPNTRAYISMDARAKLLGLPSDVGGSITALVAPDQDPQVVAERIKEQLPGIRTFTIKEAAQEIRQVFTIFILILSASGVLAVVVGGLSVINTMIMAVSERTREIGLKKAVGAGDPDILAEIVVDAGVVGGLGGLAGLTLGWGTTQVINAITTHLENLHVLEVTPRLAVGAMVFTVLLGMFAGLYPAWRASRLDPVVALRTE